ASKKAPRPRRRSRSASCARSWSWPAVASSADMSVALVAGEVSGDMLAARLLAGLRPHLPDTRFHGIGGPRMAEQGFVSDLPMDTLTVRGLFEIIPRYREIKRIQN